MKFIHLPHLPAGHCFSDSSDSIELFANADGKVIMPPNIFDAFINGNLNKLTTGPSQSKQLTAAGERWTDETYTLWPFLDDRQREDGRPYEMYPKTSENKLKYAIFVQELFGSGRGAAFVSHLENCVRIEMVRRCSSDGFKNQDGTDPATIQDVLNIVKSPEMVRLFRSGKKADVYNCIFHWVKSLTMEDDIVWLRSGIMDYFKQKNILAVIHHHSKKAKRSSLLRWAVKKGTNSVKVAMKNVEQKTFGCELDMSRKVREDDDRRSAPDYEVIFLDSKYVPTSRKKRPAYYLHWTTIDASNYVEMAMGNAVETGKSSGKSLPEMQALLKKMYEEESPSNNALTASAANTNTPMPALSVVSTSGDSAEQNNLQNALDQFSPSPQSENTNDDAAGQNVVEVSTDCVCVFDCFV